MKQIQANNAMPGEWHAAVPRSIFRHALFAFTLMAVAFGGFGVWAFRAPLAAAVIAQGSFVATGQNKIVQHLEGGIIKEILVEEGDTVRIGEPILRLDETLARATRRELQLRQIRLIATEQRLLAQYEERDRFEIPEDLLAESGDREINAILDSQRQAFNVARSSLMNDLTMIERNLDALDARKRGYEMQLGSFRERTALLDEELRLKQQLFDKGLTRREEISALRRVQLDSEGQIARLDGQIAETAEMMGKHVTQLEKARDEYRTAALTDLQMTQSELESVREQMRTAENVLSRTDVLAPVSGAVVRLYYHTTGGVIETGKPIAEILPDDAPLIIETLVLRSDIDSVKTGQEATIRLIALNQRTTPILKGEVFYISADAVAQAANETAPAREVYVVRVTLTSEELARVKGFSPKPGMPVEIMIETEARTFAQYIAKPVVDSMARAFREH
ncbi:MAG: HlyD family type I secretion periplasmic adaptor subunit [Pikeienuella sp.]